jgi:hypothetical protein
MLLLSRSAASQSTGDIDKALRFVRAVVADDSSAAKSLVASDHLWTEFYSSAKEAHGKPQLMGGRQSLIAAVTGPALQAKRVIANRRVVLIQGLIRGRTEGKSVSSEMFYLAWVREGEIKRSMIYWGTDILRDRVLGTVPSTAGQGAPEIISQTPSVKLDTTLIRSLYGFASYGLGARLAGLDGQTDIAKETLREVDARNVGKGLVRARDYLRKFSKTSLSLDQVYQAGDYAIATFTGSGTLSGTLNGRSGQGQDVDLRLLVVANLRGGTPRFFQVYVDLNDLKQKLGIK